ncbi:MAG: aldehyde dehydrogenase family protein [bacterium]
MPEVFHNYINGKWMDNKSKDYIVDVNPANTDDVLGHFQAATVEDTRRAIAAAKAAAPAWANRPAPDRARILRKASEILWSRLDDLARLMTREEGKILKEARGEMMKGLNLLDFFWGEGWRLEGQTLPSEMPDTFVYTIRQPIGVAGLITPWNFPFAIPIWKIAPALIAGNTVVFKPASLTPLQALRIVQALEEAGLPPGVLNFVVGSGKTVGNEIIQSKAIGVLSFTGSNEVGCGVYVEGAKRQAKVTCEMGGKNPLVIMEDADLDLAFAGTMQGAFGSTGQRCTATSRLLLHQSIAKQFTERVVEAAKKIKVGDGLKDGVEMGPAVDANQLKTDLEYIEIGKKEAKLLCGGKRLTGDGYDKGFFVEPTVFGGVKPSMRIFKEEVFGPVLSISTFKTFDEALEMANAVDFGLTSSIYTRDNGNVMRFIQGIEAGMVHVNSPTIGGEAQLPFGGVKATGVGSREMAREGINFFTELKTVFVDYTGKKRDTSIY